jgi:hypothetical protein
MLRQPWSRPRIRWEPVLRVKAETGDIDVPGSSVALPGHADDKIDPPSLLGNDHAGLISDLQAEFNFGLVDLAEDRRPSRGPGCRSCGTS